MTFDQSLCLHYVDMFVHWHNIRIRNLSTSKALLKSHKNYNWRYQSNTFSHLFQFHSCWKWCKNLFRRQTVTSSQVYVVCTKHYYTIDCRQCAMPWGLGCYFEHNVTQIMICAVRCRVPIMLKKNDYISLPVAIIANLLLEPLCHSGIHYLSCFAWLRLYMCCMCVCIHYPFMYKHNKFRAHTHILYTLCRFSNTHILLYTMQISPPPAHIYTFRFHSPILAWTCSKWKKSVNK